MLQPRQLPLGRGLVDVEDRDRRLVFLDEVVDADDDLVAHLDRLLEPIRGLGDLPLRETLLDRFDHPAHAVDVVEAYRVASRSMSSVSRSRKYEPPSGSTMLVTPLSWAMICWVRAPASRPRRSAARAPRRASWYEASWCRPAQRRAPERGADDVVIGLLRGQGHARGLRVEAQLPRALVLRPEAIPHHFRPDFARGTELRDLLEEIAVRIEEEGNLGREVVDVEPRVDAYCTYSMPSRSVKASSCAEVDPASRM